MALRRQNSFRSALLASTLISAFLATPAQAQDTPATGSSQEEIQTDPPPATAQADSDDIVVTGSRIRRDTFASPVPIQVITADQIKDSGTVSIADTVSDLPLMNASTVSQQNAAVNQLQAGQARADLRGLGATRTLVLLDGRRLVYSDAASPGVDLNSIPQIMVERVEVVPGGVSAVYGSEAIAGVVNLIMRKQYDGILLDGQAGISQEGDGKEFRIAGMAGTRLLSDRLSLVIGGEFSRSGLIMIRDREDEGLYPGVQRNFATLPQGILPLARTRISPYATFQILPGNVPGQGVAAAVDIRNPTQVVRLSNDCATSIAQLTCQDPALGYTFSYIPIQGRVSRRLGRAYAEYELSSNAKAFAEFSYARIKGFVPFQPAGVQTPFGGLPVFLTGDNPFLNGSTAADAQLRAIIQQAGLPLTAATRIPVAKFFEEFGGRDTSTDRTTLRGAIGMEGSFDGLGREFHWDWYAQYGRMSGDTKTIGSPNVQKLAQSLDVITLNGQPACRDAAARAAGCAPWNLIDGASPAAIAWANGVSYSNQKVQQKVAGANIATDLFNLPGGPVGIAAGVEYRKEQSRFTQDALTQSGVLFATSLGTRAGEFDVSEIYGELRLPFFSKIPFVEDLSLELAGRASHYSTIGNTTQYRAALNWAPVRDLRFRASLATAVRAPNIVELFAPQSAGFASNIGDPCDRQQFAAATAAQQAARLVNCAAAIPGYNPLTFNSNVGPGRPALNTLNGGNPDLGPEKAKTYQAGVVFQPRWIDRLQISFDFFRYELSDQIGIIQAATLLGSLCYDSTTPFASNSFCALIERDPTGTNGGGAPGGIIRAITTNQNVSRVNINGFDVALAYQLPTAIGDFSLRLDVSRMYKWDIQGLPGQAFTHFANTVNNGTPGWRATNLVQWRRSGLTLGLTTHFIGSMILNGALPLSALKPNRSPDYFRHDLRASYDFSKNLSVRAGVLNLTNRYPPLLPETFTGALGGSAAYDNRGRFFYGGLTVKY